MNRNAKLVVIRGKNKEKEFLLEAGENLIGRVDPDSDEPLAVDLDEEDVDAKVSRQHAVICLEETGVTLEDLGSLNGTFIRKDALQKLQAGEKHLLKSGDEIVIGKISLRYMEE